MSQQIDEALTLLIEEEGGYVDDPVDRGGCTNYGITLRSLSKHRGKECTCDDVKALTMDEARQFYRDVYVDDSRLKLESWPYHDLAACVLDGAVMWSGGSKRMAMLVQIAINHMGAATLKVDGRIGPVTLASMIQCEQRGLVNHLACSRMLMHAREVRRVPEQSRFIAGWMDRARGWVR